MTIRKSTINDSKSIRLVANSLKLDSRILSGLKTAVGTDRLVVAVEDRHLVGFIYAGLVGSELVIRAIIGSHQHTQNGTLSVLCNLLAAVVESNTDRVIRLAGVIPEAIVRSQYLMNLGFDGMVRPAEKLLPGDMVFCGHLNPFKIKSALNEYGVVDMVTFLEDFEDGAEDYDNPEAVLVQIRSLREQYGSLVNVPVAVLSDVYEAAYRMAYQMKAEARKTDKKFRPVKLGRNT